MNNIIKKPREKAGYMVLEAAIIMPIFIMGLAMLCFVIRYGIIYEHVYGVTADETEKTMIEMYANSIPLDSPIRIEKRLKGKVDRLTGIKAGVTLPYLSFPSADHVYCQNVKLNISMPFNKVFNSEREASQTVVFRGFIGKDNSTSSFENMEEEKPYEEVWVFARAGEKYHCEDCRFISNHAKQKVLTSEVKRKFGACKLCKAIRIQKGNIVYCFDGSGRKYHNAECALVEKYVISMDKRDSEAKGYTPCKICGGYKGG